MLQDKEQAEPLIKAMLGATDKVGQGGQAVEEEEQAGLERLQ